MIGRLVGLIWPIPILFMFGWAVSEGFVDFGGGERDLILVFLLAAYFLVFWLLYAVLWVVKGGSKRYSVWRLLGHALGWSLVLFIGAWLLLLVYSYFGIDILGIRF